MKTNTYYSSKSFKTSKTIKLTFSNTILWTTHSSEQSWGLMEA